MKYEAVIAIIDGVPDSEGNLLTNNFKIQQQPIPVVFDGPSASIGLAFIKFEENKILAEIEFYPAMVSIIYYEQYKGAASGIAIKRTGPVINEWVLTGIILTLTPSDTRLPNLRRLT
jgi:hypothetical protein